MIISYSHSFAFVHIHKTAGESVSAALAPCLHNEDLLIDGGPKSALRTHLSRHYRAARELHKHSPATAIRQHIGDEVWQSLHSFAVVRDPMSRAISLYRYLQAVLDTAQRSVSRRIWHSTPLGRSANPANWSAVRALMETATFGEFIRHPDALADPGFQPQVSMTHDRSGRRIVTEVIRLENLEEGFRDVTNKIGIKLPHQLPHKNSSNGRTSIPDFQVSAADREFVTQIFADDYAEFGFRPPNAVTR